MPTNYNEHVSHQPPGEVRETRMIDGLGHEGDGDREVRPNFKLLSVPCSSTPSTDLCYRPMCNLADLNRLLRN